MINQAILEALGQTLIDSIGQGLAVLLVTIVALWFTQNKSAKIRHNILLVSILVLPILSVNSFVNSYEPISEVMHSASISSDLLKFSGLDMTLSSEVDLSTIENEKEKAFVSPSVLIWLSYAWMVGFSFYLIRIFGSFFYLNRLNRKARNIKATNINALLNRIKIDLSLKRQVILKTSERVTSPLVYGLIKPVIIFPLGLIQGLSTEEVEAILLHELSHLKRNDFIVNIFINVLKTIYFYHPAFWWMSNQLDNEREFASDEMVLNHKANALDLIRALSKTKEYQMSVPAVGFAGSSKNQLLKRVNRIMKKQQKPNWLGGLLAIVLLASTLVLTSQQSKEKVKDQRVSGEVQIDSVRTENFGFTKTLMDLPDSVSYRYISILSNPNDSLSLEKALAEILQKKQKFMLEKLETGEITNVTRGRLELKGDSLRVYKQAFEMLEGYVEENKTDNNRKARLDKLRKLEEYKRQNNEQKPENLNEEYEVLVERYHHLQSSKLKEVEKRQQLVALKRQLIEEQSSNTFKQNFQLIQELEALEHGEDLLNEDFSQFDMEYKLQSYIERVQKMSREAESLDNAKMVKALESRLYEAKKKLDEVQRANYKEQVALKSQIRAQLAKVRSIGGEQKVREIEKLLLLLNDNLSQSLDKNEREETLDFIQEARKLLKAYYEQAGEQEKVEALREKMEQELEIKKDMMLPEDLTTRELEMMASDKYNGVRPLIWIVNEKSKDTIKVATDLNDIELPDVVEFKVYKGEKAKELAPEIQEGSGIILMTVKKAAFNRYKRQFKKAIKQAPNPGLKDENDKKPWDNETSNFAWGTNGSEYIHWTFPKNISVEEGQYVMDQVYSTLQHGAVLLNGKHKKNMKKEELEKIKLDRIDRVELYYGKLMESKYPKDLIEGKLIVIEIETK